MIYFDNSASSPLTEHVKGVMIEELSNFANPSSLHRLGFEAEKRMKKARAQVAATLGAREDEIFFTSGGTEADNVAILGAAQKMRRLGNRILSTDSEHPAVEESLKALEQDGFEVIRLSTRGGILSAEEIVRFANEKTVLAAVMHTNNETGAVYDLSTLSRMVKSKNPRCLVFSDCVQGYGKAPLIPSRMGLDMISISSHKIHGPKGVGALYVKKGLQLPARIYGGGQEKGLRSGTENLPGIVAFGAACEEAARNLASSRKTMEEMKRVIREGLDVDERIRFHDPQNASPHILSMAVLPFRSEVLLHALSEKGVFVSSGSACSSHKGKSPVLKNFGLSDREADSTVRLSFSGLNTVEEAHEFIGILKEILR